MKAKYYDIKTTPMKYYNFLRMLLILWIVVGATNIVACFLDNNFLGCCTYSIGIICEFFALNGLKAMEWKGVKYLYAVYAVSICSNILAVVMHTGYDSLDAAALGQVFKGIIGILIWAIPTYIYFEHRKPLFKPYSLSSSYVDTESQGETIDLDEETYSDDQTIEDSLVDETTEDEDESFSGN